MTRESVQRGFRRFCLGLPWVGSRPLAADELHRIRELVAQETRRQKPVQWTRTFVALMAALLVINFAIGVQLPTTVKDAFGFVFASLGLTIVFTGGVGALAEIVFGFDWKWRVACGGLALCVAAGTLLGYTALTGIGAGIGILLGNALLILRLIHLRHSKLLLAAIDVDLRAGSVWRFEGRLPHEPDDEDAEDDAADGEHDQSSDADGPAQELASTPTVRLPEMKSHAIEILPSSRIALSLDGEAATRLEAMEVSQLAATGEPSIDAPLAEPLATELPPDVEVRQRHLTAEEVTELRGLVRRELKQLLWRSLGLFWCVGIVVRFIDMSLRGKSQVGLSAAALLSTLTVVGGFAVPVVLRIRKLQDDIRERRLLITYVTDPNGQRLAVEEALFHSGVLWTQLGNPTWWRQRS